MDSRKCSATHDETSSKGRPFKTLRCSQPEAFCDEIDSQVTSMTQGTSEGRKMTRRSLGITPASKHVRKFTDEVRRVSLPPEDVLESQLPKQFSSASLQSSDTSSDEHEVIPLDTISLKLPLLSDLSLHRYRMEEKIPRRVSILELEIMQKTEETCSDKCIRPASTEVPSHKWKLNFVENKGFDCSSRYIGILILIVAYCISSCSWRSRFVIDTPHSLYVPGGGFSGFWYTLGRLNSIKDPLSNEYYCYSAGCLGVVTMLSNVTMEAAYGIASGAQKRWQRGELSRYDVTESFINGILYGVEEPGYVDPVKMRPHFLDSRVLSTLKIITSEPRDSGGIKMSIRTPRDETELKDMLLQTTWIPFAISRDLWHKGHMDGAFTLYEHPLCPISLGYGLDWDIVLHALNVNLGYDKVTLLWKKGLSQGLR